MTSTDPRIDVYLDTNVFDFLFTRGFDLCAELPLDEFRLLIPPEVMLEVKLITGTKLCFALATIERCCVKIDYPFGFSNSGQPPDEQRVAGFGVGRFFTKPESDFLHAQVAKSGPFNFEARRKLEQKVAPNEADRALGARSYRAAVLTCDKDRGPIRDAHLDAAHEDPGKRSRVVDLNNFCASNLSLKRFILNVL